MAVAIHWFSDVISAYLLIQELSGIFFNVSLIQVSRETH